MKLEDSTILIVDDNPTNLSVLFGYFKESGLKTLVAQNGKDALERAALALPDLILLDIMMPGMDGFEVCRRLKKNPATADIPVIFMTALSETADKVEGFRCGAVDYIVKPLQQEEVLARVTNHLTIRHQRRQLAELNATKDKFFSIISHDLRNQFFSLMGFAKLLRQFYDTCSDTDRKTYIKDIHDSSERTYRLFDNLVQWAKMQTGRMETKLVSIDLKPLADEVIALLSQSAATKEIDLSCPVEGDLKVHGDRDILSLILRNLVSNAVKFTPRGGKVSLTARASADRVAITVSDTGTGMTPETVEGLFRIDTHVTTKGTEKEVGTGLGLILVKEFLDLHKGEIEVESSPGVGSRFTVTLPCRV